MNCQPQIAQRNNKHDHDDAGWTHQTMLIEQYLALEEQSLGAPMLKHGNSDGENIEGGTNLSCFG